ncbi:MAG: VanZ family protein [Saccharospirillaceae bacterium]|nr:VanZ family protein [Saccharospirillaceae bacterium]
MNKITKINFVLCLIAISMLSLSPSESVPQVGGYDKIVHFLSYLILSMSFWLGFQKAKPVWLVLILLIMFGVLIEILQSFVPGRLMSLMDAIANGLGILVGYCFCVFIIQFKIGASK